jgi:uncharacterized membrane protein
MTVKTKWLYLILIISVALNIFAFGVWIGRGAKGFKEHPHSGRIEFNLRAISRDLPSEVRSKIRQLMRDKRPQLSESFQARRDTEQQIRLILSAETVDKEALRAQLDAYSSHSIRLQAPVRDILLGPIADLDQATREKVAKNIFKRRRVIKKQASSKRERN